MNIDGLQKFFSSDMMIKRTMNNLAPGDYISDDELMKYIDYAYRSLDYIFGEFRNIGYKIMDRDVIENKISKLENRAMTSVSGIKSLDDAREFYKNCITNMHSNFLSLVQKECCGYLTRYNASNSLRMTSTVNEMLHLFHSYIMNDIDTLQNIPAIDSKKNKKGYDITLRGNRNSRLNILYEVFPLDADYGSTDIITINDDKQIMMIRDLGHALSIEISVNNNIARVEYFIPKLCNVDMIKRLPGIININKVSYTANGAFEVDFSKLESALYTFISMVPTDSDYCVDYSSEKSR